MEIMSDEKDVSTHRKKRPKQDIYYKLPLFIRAVLYFLYRFIFKLGFLDAKEGIVYHFWHGLWYRMLVDVNIRRLKKSKKYSIIQKFKKAILFYPRNLSEILFVTKGVFMRRIHISTLLKLNRHKEWLKKSNIRTVIDVGANDGQFAFSLDSILPGLKLCLFEPLPDAYSKLSKRIKRYENFDLLNIALGNHKGEEILWANEFSPSSSVLQMRNLHKKIFPKTKKVKPIKVKMEKLDNYSDKINFNPKTLLKIDVEGYELEVLRGGTNVLQNIDYILTEISFKPLYKKQTSFEEIDNFLKKHNFRHKGYINEVFLPGEAKPLQADALFVKEGDI